MSIAFFDCFAGASGDMILGALLDAGLLLDALREQLAGLNLPGWEISASRVVTGGMAATRVNVSADDQAGPRSYRDLDAFLSNSTLDGEVKLDAGRILRRIAEVESHLHDEALEQVHLHELGGVDTLVDIVGAVAGLNLLGIDDVFVSALPVGKGSVATRHGTLPLPSPAMLELAKGAPLRAVDIEAELVTPTGAAILTTLARGYSAFPPMICTAVGYGAGSRDLPIANVLRLLVGTTLQTGRATFETLVVLETNIDDLNPQLYDHVMTRLFHAGAIDVWLTPIQMKKNRPGTMLAALCRADSEGGLTRILFEETNTLGVRRRVVERQALAREVRTVDTEFGQVHIKIGLLDGHELRARPEYEDCLRLAEEKNVPLIEVYRAAERAAAG